MARARRGGEGEMTTLRDADLAHAFHPQTNLAAHADTGPLVIARGEGIRVWDDQGREYIEGLAGLWCAGLGFSEPRLVEAARNQMAQLPYYHSFGGRAHAPGIRLAEELARIAPEGLTRVFFASSGSEANDSAIKIAWYYWNARGEPGRKKLIARRMAYHGVTIGSGSLTGLGHIHGGFDLPQPYVVHVRAPHHAKEARAGETEEAFSRRLADELEAAIQAEGPETVAAFVAEPLIGAGGVIVPPAGYFEAIQPVLRRHGILFIVDEVITGFGRTGRMWGSETYGLAPDILTGAKQLTSAYAPLSAVIVREDVYDAIREEAGRRGIFGHGFTYSGHPVACAVALETLAIYRERRLVEHAAAVAPRFQHRLRRLGQHPAVLETRGVGLIGGVEFKAAGAAQRLAVAAQARGLFVRPILNTVALCPPLIIEAAEIEELFDRLDAAFADL